MDRRILAFGILLMLVGVIVGSAAMNSSLGDLGVHGTVLAPGTAASMSMQLNRSSEAVLSYNSTAPIDFYFMDSSAFAMLPQNGSAHGIRGIAASMNGNGIYFSSVNRSYGGFVYTGENATAEFIGPQNNGSGISGPVTLKNGTYYAVYADNYPYAANVVTGFNYINPQSIPASVSFAGLMFMAGVIAVILSFLRKGKGNAEPREEEIRRAYDEIDADNARTGSKSRKGKAARKRSRG